MDKHGIGTDATHADHIDRIKSREYVGLHENMYFVPGTLGMGLVEGYNNIGLDVSLAKPILRAEFETDLKLICDGVKRADDVRREQIAKYRAVFETVCEKIRFIDQTLAIRLNDQPQQVVQQSSLLPGGDGDGGLGNQFDGFKSIFKCPKCGNDMTLRLVVIVSIRKIFLMKIYGYIIFLFGGFIDRKRMVENLFLVLVIQIVAIVFGFQRILFMLKSLTSLAIV